LTSGNSPPKNEPPFLSGSSFMKPEEQPKSENDKAGKTGETDSPPQKPAKKKLSLEIEDLSETMTRLERKISS
jgi:hypothetical protein